MLEFIQLLIQRYRAIIAHLKSDDTRYGLFQQRVEQLLLADAYLRKGHLLDSYPATPLQIAIIGPTQAGKSSLTNVILGAEIAGVSPLAGYTVHPQGFCHQVSHADCCGLQSYFGRFQQLSMSELTAHRYDCYGFYEAAFHSHLLPACVFWDTPDFDSIDSRDYREGVMRTIALADVVVLVVSKEKYADQSVWEMMAMLEALHQPTVICVNKLVEGTEQLIERSLQEKWLQVRKDKFPGIVPLYYQKQTGLPQWPTDQKPCFLRLPKKATAIKHVEYQNALLNQYWHDWLEPVVAEHQAFKLWDDMVEQAVQQALQEYQRDYLNHPRHYDTFQLALVELLNLLEIPGLSKILTKTRRALTWPVRKLMGIGRKPSSELTQEHVLLQQLGDHLCISLTDQLLEKMDSDTKLQSWWKDSYCLLRQQRLAILDAYNQAAADYCFAFQQNVENAANRLFNKLSEQPFLLNSLRATRVSTDAAAMAVMIHTGGVGVHDLVITPAMLSLTSLLTESAVGSYMGTVEAELKQDQLNTVKHTLFIEQLQKRLCALPQALSDNNRFNIAPELLRQAEEQRKEKKHGIRFL